MEKKKLIAEGKLDKKGKMNEKTPRAWVMASGRYSYLPALIGADDKEDEEPVGTPSTAADAADIKKRDFSEIKAEAGEGEPVKKKKKKSKAAAEE